MRRRNWLWLVLALASLIFMVASNALDLAVDALWFSAEGFFPVFRTILLLRVAIGLTAGVLAFLFLLGNLALALRHIGEPGHFLPPEILNSPLGHLFSARGLRRVALWVSLAIAAVAGLAVSADWETVGLFFTGGAFHFSDSVFGKDAGFYVFRMPFYDKVLSFCGLLGFVALLAVGLVYLVRMQGETKTPGVINLSSFPAKGRWHLAGLGAFLLLLMAVGAILNRFATLYTPLDLFTGPGYADIYGTLPMLALKAATAVVAAGLLLYSLPRQNYRLLLGGVVGFIVVWVGGNIYPSMVHRYVVSPNELDKERPYLQDNITATNRAFGLDNVQERPLTEDDVLTVQDVARNKATINNVRLWDREPLLDTFAQIQEIRTYYQFLSVDNDRYVLDGELRQTMLSPREMNPAALPSRTWVNERLTFTHGYGLTMGPVNRVNEQGLPVLFVKNLPPEAAYPELSITSPDIYFGEGDDEYVFVKTHQKEFNYPSGDDNVFSTYDGTGGVSLRSTWRRLLMAMYLRDIKLLLSEDFTAETRVLLFRNIKERAAKAAPFLRFDQDPYIVIDHGRLVWILDAYTLSDRYPYAEQVPGLGNYIRNAVKVAIDAKDGTMQFYVMDAQEPIIQAYAQLFPEMFLPLSAMPAVLRAHLRLPEDLFNLQTQMYATYHMRDVNTFYNKEDQWSVPVVGQKRVVPYYTVMKLPGEHKEEFILMLPFTPRLKDNLAAWMVARNDGDHYGQLVVYTFPKQKLVYGPKQMVARISQDPVVSQQITLWESSGSNVIRGTLLVIPIENSLIYVQPLYLKAVDGRIPELKRVVVGYKDTIAMADNLEDGLAQIFGAPGKEPRTARQEQQRQQPAGLPGTAGAIQSISAQALQHYKALQDASRQGDWARFGRELDLLGQTLNKLAK